MVRAYRIYWASGTNRSLWTYGPSFDRHGADGSYGVLGAGGTSFRYDRANGPPWSHRCYRNDRACKLADGGDGVYRPHGCHRTYWRNRAYKYGDRIHRGYRSHWSYR